MLVSLAAPVHSASLWSPVVGSSNEDSTSRMQSVAGNVAALQAISRKALQIAVFGATKRLDRTQEVTGSSPASSMKTAANRRFSCGRTCLSTSRRSPNARRCAEMPVMAGRGGQACRISCRMLGHRWGGGRGPLRASALSMRTSSMVKVRKPGSMLGQSAEAGDGPVRRSLPSRIYSAFRRRDRGCTGPDRAPDRTPDEGASGD
jgi:hypothetical protein